MDQTLRGTPLILQRLLQIAKTTIIITICWSDELILTLHTLIIRHLTISASFCGMITFVDAIILVFIVVVLCGVAGAVLLAVELELVTAIPIQSWPSTPQYLLQVLFGTRFDIYIRYLHLANFLIFRIHEIRTRRQEISIVPLTPQ